LAQQPLRVSLRVKTPSAGALWSRLTANVQRAVAKQNLLAQAAAWLHHAPTWEGVAAVGAAAVVVFIVVQAIMRMASSLLKVAVLVAAVGAVYLFVIR
jgi:hypothetical protein